MQKRPRFLTKKRKDRKYCNATIPSVHLEQRKAIQIGAAHRQKATEIAFALNDNPTSVSRESKRNRIPNRLYQDHFENALAFGVVGEKGLLAAIEVNEEKWSNRLRVTELWVEDSLRRQGIGKSLMDKAKAMAKENGNRAIILETQTSNVEAVAFYLSQGFVFDWVDLTCYGNEDVIRGEVRLELVYLFL